MEVNVSSYSAEHRLELEAYTAEQRVTEIVNHVRSLGKHDGLDYMTERMTFSCHMIEALNSMSLEEYDQWRISKSKISAIKFWKRKKWTKQDLMDRLQVQVLIDNEVAKRLKFN